MGKIPEGWENKNLFDISEVIYGYPFQSNRFAERNNGPTPIIRIRDLQNGITQTYTDEKAGDRYVVRNGDILVGMDGDFHMCRWASGKAYLNQRVALFRPMRDISPLFLILGIEEAYRIFGKIMSERQLHI
jgi:type I restriction enzyme S subunit